MYAKLISQKKYIVNGYHVCYMDKILTDGK